METFVDIMSLVFRVVAGVIVAPMPVVGLGRPASGAGTTRAHGRPRVDGNGGIHLRAGRDRGTAGLQTLPGNRRHPMERVALALVLVLASAAPAAAQGTLTYGVFTNHGETTGWSTPWDRSHNTDEGNKTGISVGYDVRLLSWADLATFVATDGAIGIGPRISPLAYGRFSPFLDAMIVNLHYNPFAARTWTPETGLGVDFALTARLGVRYHWARAYRDGVRNRSFTTISVSYAF